jgi:rhodanese-related sulfurtransferase
VEIGLFQLENLVLTPARYCVVDLRAERGSTRPEVDRLLHKARHLTAEELLAQVKDGQIPSQLPVILVCQDGRLSKDIARRLESVGHQQVYVVAGGVFGLLSEL